MDQAAGLSGESRPRVAHGRYVDAFDPEQLELDLAVKLLNQREEPPAFTRKFYHKHQSWRSGVKLHQRKNCPEMSGRSNLNEKTLELSVDTSEQVDNLCYPCLKVRSEKQKQVLARMLLRELLDCYLGDQPFDQTAGHRTATALAERLDHIAGTGLAPKVRSRANLPYSRRTLEKVAFYASRNQSVETFKRLALLAPDSAEDGSLTDLCDKMTRASDPDALWERSWQAGNIARIWQKVPAPALAQLNLPEPEAKTSGHERKNVRKNRPQGSEAASNTRLSSEKNSSSADSYTPDSYTLLKDAWEREFRMLLLRQAEERQRYMSQRKILFAPVEIVTIEHDLSGPDAYLLGLPQQLLIPVERLSGPWGDMGGIWRTFRVVADLAEDSGVCAVVSSSGEGVSDQARLVHKLLCEGMTVQAAVELAETVI